MANDEYDVRPNLFDSHCLTDDALTRRCPPVSFQGYDILPAKLHAGPRRRIEHASSPHAQQRAHHPR